MPLLPLLSLPSQGQGSQLVISQQFHVHKSSKGKKGEKK